MSFLRQPWFLLALCMSVSIAGVPGPVAAQGYDVTLDSTGEATVEEPVTVQASVTVPDQMGDWQADVTVRMYVNGERVQQKTATVRDGQTTTVSFSHTFSEAGEHSVRIEGESSYGRWSYSDSASTTISVAAAKTAAKTVAPETPSSETGTETYRGAAFPIPHSLADDVQKYRNQAGRSLNPNAFVLATSDKLLVVFTDTKPTAGRATAHGQTLGSTLTAEDTSFGTVVVADVEFETRGSPADISDVATNTDDYALLLVRLEGQRQRVASVMNTDGGDSISAASTAGIVTSRPIEQSAFENLSDAGARLISGQNRAATPLQSPGSQTVATISFRSSFWKETSGTVDGIVLPKDSPARSYVTKFAPGGTAALPADGALLYMTHTATEPKEVSASEVAHGEITEGQLVTFTAPATHARISIEETVEQGTPCGNDAVPVKEACVALTQDVLLNGGVAWSSTPSDASDLITFVGASSRLQQQPVRATSGRYRFTGKMETIQVGAGEEMQVFVVHGMTREGSISNPPSVATDAREGIRARLSDAALRTNATVEARLAASAGSGNQEDGSSGGGGGGPIGDSSSGIGPGLGISTAISAGLGLLLLRLWKLWIF